MIDKPPKLSIIAHINKAFISSVFILLIPLVISNIPVNSGWFILKIEVKALNVTIEPKILNKVFIALLILFVKENDICFLELSL